MTAYGAKISEILTMDISAVAVFYVGCNDMKSVFQFQTDSTDFTDSLGTDIRYYVNTTNWPNLNPADAMMDQPLSRNPILTSDRYGPLPANKMLLSHDYVRYLASKLFNTPFGVDLFSNESVLLENIRTLCSDDISGHVWYDVSAKLYSISKTGTSPYLQGTTGSLYLTDEFTDNTNICRELFLQMAGNDPHRFADLSNTDLPQPIPFQNDDTINFSVNFSAAQGQEELTGVSYIPDRKYQIKLVMVDASNVTNTPIDATELTSVINGTIRFNGTGVNVNGNTSSYIYSNFIPQLASTLNVDPANIVINSVVQGSIIVNYTITLPAGTTITAITQVVNALNAVDSTSIPIITNNLASILKVNPSIISVNSVAQVEFTGATSVPPAAPTDVSATSGNGQANVSWTAPVFTGGADITSYTVTSSPGGFYAVSSTTSATVTGLTNGTAYTFRVIATNIAGSSDYSTASSAITPYTVPGTPTGVSAVAGANSATISWTAPSSNGSAITGYTIRSVFGGFSATASGTATSATVTGLTALTSYTFTVVATNAAGNSNTSSTSSSVTPYGVPGAPTGISAVAGPGQATISWTAPASNGGSTITGYTVTSVFGGFSATVSGTTTSTIITGLTGGTGYTFRVVATNAAGNSSYSSTSSSVTPTAVYVPGAPNSVFAVAGDNQATVSWNAPKSTSITMGYTNIIRGSGGAVQNGIMAYGVGLSGGVYVMNGGGTQNTIFWSYDATTWTNIALDTTMHSNSVNAVGYGNGLFVAIGNSTSSNVPGTIIYSYNGMKWYDASGSGFTGANGGYGLAYANGIWVAGGSNTVTGGNILSYSTDGINWYYANNTILTTLTNHTYYTDITWQSNAVTYQNGYWHACGTYNTKAIVYSTDGINWSGVDSSGITPTTNIKANTVFYANGIWLAGITNTSNTNVIWYSTDGIHFSQASGCTGTFCYQFAYQNGVWVAVGSFGILYSINGINWNTTYYNNSISINTAYNINVINGVFVAGTSVSSSNIANNVNTILYSYDGYNWFGSSITNTLKDYNNNVTNYYSCYVMMKANGKYIPIVKYNNVNMVHYGLVGLLNVSVTENNNGGSAITAYKVTSSPGAFTATTSGSTSATVTGLTSGTSYSFSVVATNIVGDSSASNLSPAIIPMGVPSAPTSVSATSGNTQVTVSWTAPSNNGHAITSYTVTSSPGGFTATVNGTTTTATITGLTNGTAYTFSVVATNSVGNSTASSASNSVTPNTFSSSVVRFDASMNVTSSSGAVSSWTDTTGVYSAAQSNASYKPVITNNVINGKPALTFNHANNQLLTTASLPAAFTTTNTGFTTFIVMNTTSVVSGMVNYISTNGGWATRYCHMILDSNNLYDPFYGTTSGGTGYYPGVTVPNITPFILMTNYTNASGTTKAYNRLNGVSTAVGSFPGGLPLNIAKLDFGGASQGSRTITGNISEIWLYPINISATEIQNVEAYLSNKYNIAVSLQPPASVTATSGNGQATVSWTATPNTATNTITGYTVTSSPAGFTTTVGASTTSVTTTGLTAGTAYTFNVVSKTASATSSATASNSVTV